MCENIKSTLQEWFKAFPDDENCPHHNSQFGVTDILDDWNGLLGEALINIPVLHLQWYDIQLRDYSDGEELFLAFGLFEEHPMYHFYPQGTGFHCPLGKLIYERCTVPSKLPFLPDEEKDLCVDLEYDESAESINATFDDVVKRIEAKMHAYYEWIRIIDAYMADHTPEENKQFVSALTNLFNVEDQQLVLEDVMDADWRIGFINVWENG